MFDKKIRGGIWYSCWSDRIGGDLIENDASFYATLKMLLLCGDNPRMPEGYNINVYRTVMNDFREFCKDYYEYGNDTRDRIWVIGSRSTLSDEEWFRLARERLWLPECTKVANFFKGHMNCVVQLDAEQRTAYIIIQNINVSKVHLVQCAIPAILPWYFPKERGMSDDEVALLKSLEKSTPDEYEALYEKFASDYGAYDIMAERYLTQFESSWASSRVQVKEERLNSIRADVNDFNNRINELLQEKRDIEMELVGWRAAKGKQQDGELLKYIKQMSGIKIVNGTVDPYSYNSIFYVVEADLDIFDFDDEHVAEVYVGDTETPIYNRGNADYRLSKADMKLLYEALFLRREYTIQTCAAYYITSNGRADAYENYNYGSCPGRLPNPHIWHFGCASEYRRAMTNKVMAGDFEGAIDISVSSARTFMFTDSPVARRFGEDICTYADKKFIRDAEGNLFSPIEVIKKLKEDQNGKTN